MTLQAAVASKQILVVCGAGGVGKTSVSAALGVAAASDRRAIVLTIDPARRLATAMGIRRGLGHAETPVEVPGAGGSLHAAMLDMRTAWDELVDRYAPDGSVASSIRANRLYAGLSEHFVGSQGYMAMERLADLHERGAYDLIVVDTPPTRHALDFLEAPKRMTDFVGGSLLRWFARPYAAAGRLGARAFSLTATPVLKLADRILGSQVLEDLSSFVLDFQQLYDAFKRRAVEVLRLLQDPGTGFVVVTTTEGAPLTEAGFFLDRLADERLPLAGVVANRVTPAEFGTADAHAALRALEQAADLGDGLGDGLGDDAGALAAREALRQLTAAASRDAQRVADLGRRARLDVTTVPLLGRDVRDIDSLAALAAHLTGG